MNIPLFRVFEATECIIASHMNPYKKLWSHPASISKMSRIFLPCRLVLFHELCLGFTFVVNSCAQTVNISSNNINALKSQQKTFRYWLNVAWQSATAIKHTCYNIQQQMKQNSKECTICNASLTKQRLFTMYSPVCWEILENQQFHLYFHQRDSTFWKSRNVIVQRLSLRLFLDP